jgi:uncharacterized membrane protein
MGNQRLYFIDALRAWAILMMLQGHFVDGLLAEHHRITGDFWYETWKFFRGITAPVFFTISGFIIVYLLESKSGRILKNPRIGKGLRRGIQLLIIGYLLRLYVPGLLQGKLYPSFFYVDVLHCIGLSLIGLIGIYIFSLRLGRSFNFWLLFVLATLIFLTEPLYARQEYPEWPVWLANYITQAYGSVFTVIPWIGYSFYGGGMALVFLKFMNRPHFFRWTMVTCTLLGIGLIYGSAPLFDMLQRMGATVWLDGTSAEGLLLKVIANNYLFIRLGHVLITLTVFIGLRRYLTHTLWVEIGQSTLNIYIVHFILLYGSFTGVALYRIFYRSLDLALMLPAVFAFMFICVYLALLYKRLTNKGYNLRWLVSRLRRLWQKTAD